MNKEPNASACIYMIFKYLWIGKQPKTSACIYDICGLVSGLKLLWINSQMSVHAYIWYLNICGLVNSQRPVHAYICYLWFGIWFTKKKCSAETANLSGRNLNLSAVGTKIAYIDNRLWSTAGQSSEDLILFKSVSSRHKDKNHICNSRTMTGSKDFCTLDWKLDWKLLWNTRLILVSKKRGEPVVVFIERQERERERGLYWDWQFGQVSSE